MCIEITGFNVEVLLGVKSIPADCPWGQELVCAQSDEHMADFEGSQVNIWQSILFFFFHNSKSVNTMLSNQKCLPPNIVVRCHSFYSSIFSKCI